MPAPEHEFLMISYLDGHERYISKIVRDVEKKVKNLIEYMNDLLGIDDVTIEMCDAFIRELYEAHRINHDSLVKDLRIRYDTLVLSIFDAYFGPYMDKIAKSNCSPSTKVKARLELIFRRAEIGDVFKTTCIWVKQR